MRADVMQSCPEWKIRLDHWIHLLDVHCFYLVRISHFIEWICAWCANPEHQQSFTNSALKDSFFICFLPLSFFFSFQAILNGIFLHVHFFLISTCKTNWLIITMAWRNPRAETIRPFKWARTQAFLKSMTHEKTMTKYKERE